MATAGDIAKKTKDEKNLELWKRVCVTDPERTKQFQGKGGFSGTAINPTYQIERATELFGPMGQKWRVEIVDEKFVEGGIIGVHRESNTIIRQQIHTIRIKLHYEWNAIQGVIEAFGHTTLVTARSGGWYTVEDYGKMSLTDAIGSALKQLGFSADIFLGLYDDNKYVREAALASAGASTVSEDTAHEAATPVAGSGCAPGEAATGGNGRSQQSAAAPESQASSGPTWQRYTIEQIMAMDEATITKAAVLEIQRLGIDPLSEGLAVAKHYYKVDRWPMLTAGDKQNFLYMLNDSPSKLALLRDVPPALLAEYKRQAEENKKRKANK